MRDNYFEKKLEITKNNLAWSIQETRNVEIQMEHAKAIFDDKIKTGNEAIKRLESIQSKAEKDIKHYEDMIKRGYKFIDIRNGKAYKTEANLQKQLLSEKTPRVEPPDDGIISQAAKEIEIELESRKAEKARLKAERKARHKAEEAVIAKKKEAIRIKAEAEALRKIEQARKLREAEEKVRAAEEAKLELERLAKEEEEPADISPVEEILEKVIEENIVALTTEDIEEIPEEIIYDTSTPIPDSTIPEPTIVYSEDNELEKLRATRDQVKQVKEEMNDKISQEEKDKKWIAESTQGNALAILYKEQEGGNAIWNGVVTKGFRTFCRENNLKIGD